jgi:hypothetical protein
MVSARPAGTPRHGKNQAGEEGIDPMTSKKIASLTGVAALAFAAAGAARADDQPAAPAAPAGPTALSTPAMSSSLSNNGNPYSVDTGPLGKIYFSGQLTGFAGWESPESFGANNKGKVELSNAQVEIQKTDGLVQFYVQAGYYNFPSLGAPILGTQRITDDTFKVVPVAFLKLQPTAEWSILVGKLPTLIGAEYTFTFENLNIERGLLWNQEPAISTGVQVNYAKGPLTVSLSLNDGYYSSHWSTISGLVSYVISPKDTIAFAGSGNTAEVNVSRFVTPIAQNNGTIWNILWTHTDGNWVINPYIQWSTTPKITKFGLPSSASTFGGAVLAKYTVNSMFNVAGRAEYITSSGSDVALLYGVKSDAWSLTLTPTFQYKTFFVRGEVSYTKIESGTPGSMFGKNGDKDDQTRAMIELGFLI